MQKAENSEMESKDTENDDFCFALKAPTEHQRIKINKWRVREGFPVSIGQLILLYKVINGENDGNSSDDQMQKLKSNRVGVVKKRLYKEGDIVQHGSPLVIFTECVHTTVIKDMCADCGADLRQTENGQLSEASVPMVHSVPDLKVTQKLAQKLGQDDTRRLLQDRKLVLLVDLDQTIIHTTNDNVPNNIKGIYHFQLYGPNSPWYHTRLRPGTADFLEKMSQFYELHICTFGARNYAHMIAQFLDPQGKYFSHRILSRDECFNATSKTDNLRALFPNGDAMVCIIDDREDVWNMASNLIQVKPYHFFQHTGDINAPPGLSKHELDGEGLDFKELENAPVKQTADDATNNKNDSENIEIADGEENKADVALEEKESVEKDENVENPKDPPEIESTDKESSASETASKAESKTIYDESNENDTPKIKLATDSNNQIEIEDPDDYLLHLECILETIHKRFYSVYDETQEIPDLKVLVPQIRSEVLKGQILVFSGLVPTHMKLEQSRAYFIAKSLGADVYQNISPETTHLVAVTSGTFKVNAAKKNPNIKVVNASWLWACAERWEHVDEMLFQLDRKTRSKQRQPPAHCHSPEHTLNYSIKSETLPAASMQQQAAYPTPKFVDTLNPLLVFSNDELADINNEFNQFFESDSSSEEEHVNIENPPLERSLRKRKRAEQEEERTRDFFKRSSNLETERPTEKKSTEADSSSDESIAEENDSDNKNEDEDEDDDDDEIPSAKFRRGEDLPSDIDIGSDSENSNTHDLEDDGEWNMMGAALEREFLGMD